MPDVANSFRDEPVCAAQQDCPKDPPPPVSKVLKAFFANKKESRPPKGKKTPVEVSFSKITGAIVASKVFIVVETADLKGGTLSIEILGSNDTKVIVDKDAALTVVEAGAEKTTLSAAVGNWATKTEYSNGASLADKVVIEVELKPLDKEKIKEWRTSIGQVDTKKALFHLKVTAQGGNDTEYTCEDDTLTSPDKEKSIFLNKKDMHFELYACYCGKEFTEDDIRSFYSDKAIFSADNCPLPADKKTYAEFTKELNIAMKARSINSCLRKSHFLSQIEAETGLLTTLEYASGWDYDHSTHEANYNKYKLYLDNKKLAKNPHEANNTTAIKRGYNRYLECKEHGHDVKGYGPKYKGKGLIQLTWKDNHDEYFTAISRTELSDTPEELAKDLHLVCDSAAWYWTSHSAWGNLNPHADEDDLIYVSVGVNGGLNGFDHRKANLKRILDLLKVKDACLNLNVTGKTVGVYKYSTSAMRNKTWGKNHKADIEAHDD